MSGERSEAVGENWRQTQTTSRLEPDFGEVQRMVRSDSVRYDAGAELDGGVVDLIRRGVGRAPELRKHEINFFLEYRNVLIMRPQRRYLKMRPHPPSCAQDLWRRGDGAASRSR